MRPITWTLSEHGRALGAMETIGVAMVWRGKIQEESLYYGHHKHDGSLPLVGVNTFLPKEHAGEVTTKIELIRSTPGRKSRADRPRQTVPTTTQRVGTLSCEQERAG